MAPFVFARRNFSRVLPYANAGGWRRLGVGGGRRLHSQFLWRPSVIFADTSRVFDRGGPTTHAVAYD
jgi:hypothetical protein